MKISSSAASSLKGDNAILPLIPVERSDGVPSERLVTHVLLSTPTDADSPKYKIHSRICDLLSASQQNFDDPFDSLDSKL